MGHTGTCDTETSCESGICSAYKCLIGQPKVYTVGGGWG